MSRRPNRKPSRNKPPSVGQRRRAEARRAAGGEAGEPGPRHRLDVRIDKAQSLWREQKFEEAIYYYERALARDPLNPVLLVDVARAHALRYRFASAEKLVNQACTLYPNDAQLQAMLGESYAQIEHFDRAIACYERALELAPTTPKRPQILLELARMHERLHNLPAARRSAEEAVSLAPGVHYARYILANIERRVGNSAAAEATWNELTQDDGAPRNVSADSHYQLAAICDKAGNFDDAFAHLTQAKRILGNMAARYSDEAWAIARQSGKTIAMLTQDHCDRWSAVHGLTAFNGRIALLASHPRSGTTLLEQVLDSHPGAISADELQIMADMVFAPLGQKARSPDPIPQVLDRATVDDLNEVRKAYWSSMEGALQQQVNGRVLIDKNPELTLLLPLVARVFPEMKVIFALRDPRDVVISCFSQRLPLNPVSVNYLTLEDTVKKYVRMMHAWLKLRGMIRNPWIEVRYEDMVADLESQARRVLEFLGLPWDDCVLEYHRRAQTKHVHSPTYEAVTKPVYSTSVGRWRNYEKHLAPYQELLRPFVEAFGYE
jgi:tetratricopeptide (TPR) repeat protein